MSESTSWEEVYRVQTARIEELEALARNYRESWEGAQIDVEGLLARAKAAESRLADIAGLRRYSLVYDEMQQYDDGMYVRADELQAALGQG